ncbi:hypothetical protein AVHM3334_15765 [Acidovorax sp. SUPP3334]|nr:hypothetical protein AVHM3334_15765 [Acidovorax sp. SUPP3334]
MADEYARWFLARLRTLEPRVAQQAHLCAGRFTAADVSVGYALLLAGHLGLAASFTPAVADYWARLRERPGFIRAMAAQAAAAQDQGVEPTHAPDLRP